MMKATHQWIDSYVGSGLSAAQVAERITMAGIEVEHIEAVGDDACLTFEVTSNRTDCLGILGLARELAATLRRTITLPPVDYPVAASRAAEASGVVIEPDALAACPHYTAQIIRGVKVGPSPAWLRKRLEAIGLKPINNIVDITNFVLYETGQPLHAFDLGKLAGRRIVVRMARDGERFRPIADRKQRAEIKLDARTLVIADAENAQAVAGIMGGADSEVSAATTDILLESAYFEPHGNRATTRRLELDSDSTYRFSRGVDPGGIVFASRRAARMITEIAGGEILDGILEAGKAAIQPRRITLAAAEIQRVLGISVPADEVTRILAGLGLGAADAPGGVAADIPSFRRDLEQPIDLVEEVGRIYGLDRVPAPLRMTVASARPSRRQRARAEIRTSMIGQGFCEALTDTFVSAKGELAAFSVFGAPGPRLEARAPVNAELPALRRNLLGSLMAALAVNQRHGNPNVRLFEVANVFVADADSTGEREVVGILAPGFLEAKGALEALLEALRVPHPPVLEPLRDAAFAPGRAARLSLGGRLVGMIAEPAPAALKAADCEGPCGLAELDLNALVDAWVETPQFVDLPRFPTAERDLAFVLDAATPWAVVESAARAACDDTLRDVRLFDEFRGKSIGDGRKSLAFRLYLRRDDRTLTTDEINALTQAVIDAVTTRANATLRA